MTQQTNFSPFTRKHGTFCCAMNTRETLDSIYLCPCIGPVPTRATKVPSSPARALLLGAIGDYCLFFTSGFHRPLDLCEGQQSWRQPNANQSATSNCSIHDPVTRGLLWSTWFTRRFVGTLGFEQSSFTSWNLLFSQMGPRWAGSGSGPWLICHPGPSPS